MTEHPQKLAVVGNRSAEVDADLVPLIEAIWRLGIGTGMSCQDNAGRESGEQPLRRVWLYFYGPQDGQEFLHALFPDSLADTDALPEVNENGEVNDGEDLTDADIDGFRNRVLPMWTLQDWQQFHENRLWHYGASANDFADGSDRALPVLGLSIRFPFTDLPEVLRRLELSLDEQGTVY